MEANCIRLASYNIRKARGLDQRRRPERILQVVNGLAADVVLLQEADTRLAPRFPALPRALITAETDFQLLELGAPGPGIGWHGNAVLLRKGLAASDIHRLPLPGFEPRGAVRMTLGIGGGLTVVAAHLGLLRRDRRAQLHTIAEAVAHTGPCVIAGDFNEWSARKGLEPLDARFDSLSPGRSFHARRPMAELDRFAVSHGITVRAAGVERGSLARVASDHLPVWCDLTIPGEPIATGAAPARWNALSP